MSPDCGPRGRLRSGRALAGRGSGDGDLLTAVDGLAARRSVREIAGDIHGTDTDVVVDWDPDSKERAQVRRLVERAKFLMGGGYLELAAGERPHM